MNGRTDRAETAIQKVAEQNVKLAETMQALADSQKHAGAKLDALTDIVRNWYERHGNGSGSQHPS
jgi:N-acetylmuramic acid 6-phosphate (MurNAc-6-P) etherase